MATNSEREPPQPTNRTTYRVVVAARNQASTFAVIAALDAREDIVVVQEVQDAVAATEAAVTQAPDLVLVDVRLDDLGDACRWIDRVAPAARLVLLQDGDANDPVAPAVSTDSAAVPAPCSLEEFLASVDALRDGGAALDPFTARIALATVRRNTQLDRDARPRLTEREWEVLQLRARGLRVGELARQLSVSENTVKHHLVRIREKLLGSTSE